VKENRGKAKGNENQNGAPAIRGFWQDETRHDREIVGQVRLYIQGDISIEGRLISESRLPGEFPTLFELEKNWNKSWIPRMRGDEEQAKYLVGDVEVLFSRTETGQMTRPERFTAIDPEREAGAEGGNTGEDSVGYIGKGKGRVMSMTV
jgi:hypothetical protein